jgi:hypothetical protein
MKLVMVRHMVVPGTVHRTPVLYEVQPTRSGRAYRTVLTRHTCDSALTFDVESLYHSHFDSRSEYR